MSAAEIDAYLSEVDEPKRSTLEARTWVDPGCRSGGRGGHLLRYAGLPGSTERWWPASRRSRTILRSFPHSGSVLAELGEVESPTGYEFTSGSLHFAIDQPLPDDLVRSPGRGNAGTAGVTEVPPIELSRCPAGSAPSLRCGGLDRLEPAVVQLPAHAYGGLDKLDQRWSSSQRTLEGVSTGSTSGGRLSRPGSLRRIRARWSRSVLLSRSNILSDSAPLARRTSSDELAAAVGQRRPGSRAGRPGPGCAPTSPFASRASTTSVADRARCAGARPARRSALPRACDSTRTARICDGVTSKPRQASPSRRRAAGAPPRRTPRRGPRSADPRCHGNRVARFGVVTS